MVANINLIKQESYSIVNLEKQLKVSQSAILREAVEQYLEHQQFRA